VEPAAKDMSVERLAQRGRLKRRGPGGAAG
jgi:hypothetical protein